MNSDIMFDEVPGYKKGFWKEFCVHDEHNIKGFFGNEYRFLSNFHKCDIWYEGLKYPSTECAYQSAKCIPELRESFTKMTSYQSKQGIKIIPKEGLVEDWENKKFKVMQEVTFQKYLIHKDLRQKLLDTGDKYLEETNNWQDIYWGVCNGKGKNNLGKILMLTRSYF